MVSSSMLFLGKTQAKYLKITDDDDWIYLRKRCTVPLGFGIGRTELDSNEPKCDIPSVTEKVQTVNLQIFVGMYTKSLCMRCQVGKKHLLFTYMAIIFFLMDVIFYHIGTI